MSHQSGASLQAGGSNAGRRKHHTPTKYIVGYGLSLLLTAIAFVTALTRNQVPVGSVVILLMILAAFQIVVQLYFFMHVTEGDGPPFHTVFLILGLLFTFAISLMSIWIMSFPAFMNQVA